LVDVAVEVDEGHAFEEGVDAEPDEESGDGMDGAGVAVAGVGVVAVVMLDGFLFFFAAGAVVVAVFDAAGELFKQELDEEADHDGGGDFEVDAGGDETIGVVAQKDVGHKIDEAGGEKECTSEDGDAGGDFGADMLAARDEGGPDHDARHDEDVG
jgi:hypothetical protein